MKSYIDGLVSQQKAYNIVLLLLFSKFFVAYLLKEDPTSGPLFSAIPLLGIKATNDRTVMTWLLGFSIGISMWVSVEMLWWLYSFHKYHPNECLDVDYLPGLLFMPWWIRLLAGFIIVGMIPGSNLEFSYTKLIGLPILYLIGVSPLIISGRLRKKFKKAIA